MAKGSPDSQHELIISGIGRCLKVAYPTAKLTFGQVIPDLRLKPDLFIVHRNGQRWAYEVVNKSKAAGEIEAKHRQYLQAGVHPYWILRQTLGPEKPLHENLTRQSVWVSDEVVDAPKRHRLNGLQRTLARLGGGHLYVFFVHKPLLDLVQRPALKLLMVGLDIYHFSPDQLDAEWLEGSWDFVPLPYLVFDERGRPQPEPGIGVIPSHLQPFVEPFSNRSLFVQEALASLDTTLQAPGPLVAAINQALGQLAAQYSQVKLPQTEELARAGERIQQITAEMKQKQTVEEPDFLKMFDALDNLVAALPLQGALREVIPTTGEAMRQIFEVQRWLEEDEHLQELLAEM